MHESKVVESLPFKGSQVEGPFEAADGLTREGGGGGRAGDGTGISHNTVESNSDSQAHFKTKSCFN